MSSVDKKVIKYRNRHAGYSGESKLEFGGPTEWKNMDEFSEYLERWQEKENVRLVYWDSKRSKAYNSSNKFKEDNPNYVHESLSAFPYKAWVCANGRKGLNNPCRFIVRARFVPSIARIACKVVMHKSPDGLPNGHNHRVEVPSISVPSKEAHFCSAQGQGVSSSTKEEGEMKEIVRLMREDPDGCASRIETWSTSKRLKLCRASLERFESVFSREDICRTRQMIEALNVVDLMARYLWKKGKGSQNEEELSSSSSARKGATTSKITCTQNFHASEYSAGVDDERSEKDDEKSEDTRDSGAAYCTIVERPVDAKEVPQSRYADRTRLSPNALSVGALLKLIRSGATIGLLQEKLELFPLVVNQKMRMIELFKHDKWKQRSSPDNYFILDQKDLEKFISRGLAYRRNVNAACKKHKKGSQKDLPHEVEDEDDVAEFYGVRFQIYEKVGRQVVECSSVNLSLRTLLDMRRVQEVTQLVKESILFLSWVDNVDSSLDTIEEAKKIDAEKRFIKTELSSLRATDYQGGDFKSDFAYCMRSLLRLKGTTEHSRGRWLTSDAIHMGVLLIRKELRGILGPAVFVLPPLEWDTEQTASGMEVSKKGEAGEQTIDILAKQEEEITDASPRDPGRSVIYTVINKGGTHWLAIEICVRTRNVLVYDPADALGARQADGSEKYFTRLRFFLEALLSKKSVPPPPLKHSEWKCGWTRGGQQCISSDSVNCGIYALEWIKFRFHSAVRHRRMTENEKGATFLREKMRDTTMNTFDDHFIEKARIKIAHFALHEIRRIARERREEWTNARASGAVDGQPLGRGKGGRKRVYEGVSI